MPKLKTHKGLRRRVKVTATGKIKRCSTGIRHLMRHKSGKAARQLRRRKIVPKIETAFIRRALAASE
jgi:large subunit ribosomal protein L35